MAIRPLPNNLENEELEAFLLEVKNLLDTGVTGTVDIGGTEVELKNGLVKKVT